MTLGSGWKFSVHTPYAYIELRLNVLKP